MKKLIIAIDGPAASGKSSVAKALAKKLGYRYIDTGAMYRCCTLEVLNRKIDVNDEAAIAGALKHCRIDVVDDNYFLNGQDVSKQIRDKEVTLHVSKVCSYPVVRNFMVKQQQKLGKEGGVVLDGRDIGTYVFPNADLKIYQTASLETRALRRYQENKARGIELSYEAVYDDIVRRDHEDSTRELAPLIQAKDAIVMDTTSLSVMEAVHQIYDLAQHIIKEEEYA